MSFLLALALNCPVPQIIDLSAAVWDIRDAATLERSKTRCGEKFPKSPCLKVFTRIEPGRYTVICGAAQ